MLVSTYGELFCSPLNVVLSTIPSEVDKMEARLDTAENRPPRTYDQSDYGPYGCKSFDSHGWRGRKPGRNRKSRVKAAMKPYHPWYVEPIKFPIEEEALKKELEDRYISWDIYRDRVEDYAIGLEEVLQWKDMWTFNMEWEDEHSTWIGLDDEYDDLDYIESTPRLIWEGSYALWDFYEDIIFQPSAGRA